jgi:hypothetical protein
MTALGRHPTRSDPFAEVLPLADAVLYEGYLLYPYRRSSGKSQVRWQFGVLAPRNWIEAHGVPDPGIAGSAESWFQQADCLIEAPLSARVRVRLRFLQLQRRQLAERLPGGELRPVDALDVDGTEQLSFDEAVPRDIDVVADLGQLLTDEQRTPVEIDGDRMVEPAGRSGQIIRTTWPLTLVLSLRVEPARAPFPLCRLRVRVENAVHLDPPAGPRDTALRQSLIATHLLIEASDGHFLSLLDPPEWAAEAVTGCENRHVFPVLAGSGGTIVLCSPIILYDQPRIAPESPGDLHDATEIDEILSLRTRTLTDAEKREARATDPRAAAILDRVDAMPPEMMAKLHGAVRSLGRDDDAVLVGGVRVGAGSRVRLRPRGRGTDAHDMFLAGRAATVHALMHDVDGSVYLAVTVDDDPAAELHEWYGRYFHFSPDEVQPV